MSIEVKIFPQFSHYCTSVSSVIVYDVSTSTIMELDSTSAAILEEAVVLGEWTDRTYKSARRILHLRDVPDSSIDASIEKVQELLAKGLFMGRTPEYSEYSIINRDVPSIACISLNITQSCNLKCVYCFASGGTFGDDKLPELMSSSVGCKSIDFLFSHDSPSYMIRFFGGEPLLNWPLLEELTKYASEKARANGKTLSFFINTNATLLNPYKVSFLKKHHFGVLVSIDGDESHHNLVRPYLNTTANSYEETRKGIEMLTEGGITPIGAAAVTSHQTSPREILSQLRKAGIKIGRANLTEVYSSTDDDYVLSAEGLQRYSSQMVELVLGGEIPNIVIPSIGGRLNDVHSSIKTLRTRFCNFPRSSLAVDSLGRVYACPKLCSIKKYELGNVFDGIDYSKLNDLFHSNNTNLVLGCRSCWARYLCGGGCPAENFAITGTTSVPRSHWCYTQIKLIEAYIEWQLGCLKQMNPSPHP